LTKTLLYYIVFGKEKQAYQWQWRSWWNWQ